MRFEEKAGSASPGGDIEDGQVPIDSSITQANPASDINITTPARPEIWLSHVVRAETNDRAVCERCGKLSVIIKNGFVPWHLYQYGRRVQRDVPRTCFLVSCHAFSKDSPIEYDYRPDEGGAK